MAKFSRWIRVAAVGVCALLGLWPCAGIQGASPPADAPRAPATQPIVLSRPLHVGDHFKYAATLTTVETFKVSVDGKETPGDQNRSTLELEAQVEVLAVTPQGRPIKARFQVEKFFRTKPEPGDLLPRGSAAVVEGGSGRWNVKPIRGKFSGEIGDLLAKLADVERFDNRAGDDELFGNPQPQSVGSAWPVSTSPLSKDLTRAGITIAPDRIDGTSRLADVFALGGVPCAKITSDVKLRDASMPLPDNLADAKVQKCDARLAVSGFYPLDRNKLPLATGTITDVTFVATRMIDGRSATITYTSYEKLEQRYSNLNQD